MSTKGIISLHKKDGTVECISCNYDSYLSNLGKKLVLHYDSLNLVQKMLSLGNLVSLDISIKKSKFFARDEGEDLSNNRVFPNMKDFTESEYVNGYYYQHIYIFSEEDSIWFYYDKHRGKLSTLESVIDLSENKYPKTIK